jgi:Protein of Unknown function (DUF2784)
VLYRFLADTVLALHAAFAVFVALGWLLVAWRRRWAWLHVPAVAWGIGIELVGGVCPLTPLENELRRRAGQAGYAGDFLEHYLLAALYPDGLTRGAQIAVGVGVLAINVAAYGWLWRRHATGGE